MALDAVSPTQCGGSNPLELPVLVVNRFLQPVQVTTARRAMVLLFGDVAMAVDEHGEMFDFDHWRSAPIRPDDDVIPVVGGAIRIPRVVHLRRYDRMRTPTVRLSRKNVMLRDEHQCQYCERRLPARELNIDHVVPKCRGGRDEWENLATACKRCNHDKGWKTLEEAGLRLLRKPSKPRWSTTVQILMGQRAVFNEWSFYLKTG